MSDIKLRVQADFEKLMSQIDSRIRTINGRKRIIIPITTETAKTTSSIYKVNESLRGLIDKNKKVVNSNKGVVDSTNKVNKEMTTLDSKLGSAVRKMGDAVVKAGLWAVAMGALYGSLRLVRTGVEFLLDLDKSLTEISIVTGMTREETYKLAQEYNGLARTMGQLTQDVTGASVAFFRQGKTMQQTVNLTRASLIASSIANIDMADASEYLTSSLNGFMWTSQQAIDVIDKFAKISSSAGTSFEELAIGFQKANSSAYSAGLTFDELASYMATISEVTRESSSSIGNSLKTIITRFGKIADLGKLEEDGITATLNGIDASLRRVGITMRDETTGQIRDLGEIIRELGGQWENLEINQRNAIAFQIAGVRQMNRFIALMDNYGRSLELMYKSITAQGTAMQQYNAYMQSTEFQVKRLKAEFEGFFLVLNQNGGVLKSMIEYFADILTFFRSFGELLSKNKGALVLFITALVGIGVALTAMGSVVPAVLVSIYAVGKALGYTGNIIESSEEKFKKYADEQKDMIANQKSAIKSTEDLATRLDLMAKTEDGVIKNKQELNMWYEALEKIQPNILEGLNKETATYADLKAIIEQVTNAKKIDLAQSMKNARADITTAYGELGLLKAKKVAGAKQEGLYGTLFPASYYARLDKDIELAEKSYEEKKRLYDELVSVEAQPLPVVDDPNGNGGGGGGGVTNATTATTKYTSALEDYFNILQKISNVQSDLADIDTMKSMASNDEALKLTSIQIDKIEELISLNEQLKKEQEKTKESLINSLKPYSQIVKISDDYNSLIVDVDKYNRLLNDSQKEDVDNLINSFDKLRVAINGTGSEILKLQKNKSDLIKSLTDMADEIAKKISDAYTKYYTEMKNRAIALNEEQIKSEQDRSKAVIDNLQKELDMYNDIIDAKIKSLDKNKEEENYNKRINKILERKQDVQDKINVLSIDTSLESKNKQAELSKELKEIEEELLEESNNREYELRKENLEELKDNYGKQTESKISAEEKKLNSVVNNLKTEQEYYENHYDDLIAKEADYARIRREILNNNLSEIKADLENFVSEMPSINADNILGDINTAEQIGSSYQEITNKANGKDMALASRLVTDSGRVGYDIRTGSLLSSPNEAQLSARKYLDATYEGGSSAYARNQAKRFEEIGVYHNGGIVGGKSFDYNTEKISKLLMGELVLNKQQLSNIPKIIGDINDNGKGDIKFDSLLTVNGNVDKDLMPKLEDLVLRTANKVAEIQKNKLNSMGVFRTI